MKRKKDGCFDDDGLSYARIKEVKRDTDWYALKEIKEYWTDNIQPIQKKDQAGIPRCYDSVINSGLSKEDALLAIQFYAQSEWHRRTNNYRTLRSFLNPSNVRLWMTNRGNVRQGRTAEHIVNNI